MSVEASWATPGAEYRLSPMLSYPRTVISVFVALIAGVF